MVNGILSELCRLSRESWTKSCFLEMKKMRGVIDLGAAF